VFLQIANVRLFYKRTKTSEPILSANNIHPLNVTLAS
jgi:hypothetical protein